MKRRAFFLTSFLAPVVAFFKPALKPSVAEVIEDPIQHTSYWVVYETNPTKYNDWVHDRWLYGDTITCTGSPYNTITIPLS